MPTKFAPLSAYEEPVRSQGYSLLPFRFAAFDENKYVVTNMVGEHLFVDRSAIALLVKHELDPSSPDYHSFKAKHILFDEDSKSTVDLMALKVRTKLHPLAQFTGLHIFVVTLGCEHTCSYCQVSRHVSDLARFHMSREVADKALEFAFFSPSQRLKIEFQGGEPLLNRELVAYISGKARARALAEARTLDLVIATNLALVDSEVLQLAREHDIYFSTSLDGPADLHDRHRKRSGGSSYERTIEGINKVRGSLGSARVSALMTTTVDSLKRAREIIDEYLSQGFHNIFLRPISPYGFAVRSGDYGSYSLEDWLRFYFDGIEYIIDLNRTGIHFVEHYAATILRKMLTPFETGYVDLRNPAGLGIGTIVYNYNGKVYASDEGRMLSEMGDESFCLGHVLEDSYHAIMSSPNLLEPLEQSFLDSVPMCSDCVYQPFCGADPVFHHATQKNYIGHKPTSEFCARNMAIFRRLLSLMRADDWTANLFMRWAIQ